MRSNGAAAGSKLIAMVRAVPKTACCLTLSGIFRSLMRLNNLSGFLLARREAAISTHSGNSPARVVKNFAGRRRA